MTQDVARPPADSTDDLAAPARAVAAIVARDRLRLSPDEYDRLVRLYAESQGELEALRIPEVRYRDPACPGVYPTDTSSPPPTP